MTNYERHEYEEAEYQEIAKCKWMFIGGGMVLFGFVIGILVKCFIKQ